MGINDIIIEEWQAPQDYVCYVKLKLKHESNQYQTSSAD